MESLHTYGGLIDVCRTEGVHYVSYHTIDNTTTENEPHRPNSCRSCWGTSIHYRIQTRTDYLHSGHVHLRCSFKNLRLDGVQLIIFNLKSSFQLSLIFLSEHYKTIINTSYYSVSKKASLHLFLFIPLSSYKTITSIKYYKVNSRCDYKIR